MKNCGITTSDEDLLSSADVAAEMLPVGSTALVLADEGVREALLTRGVKLLDVGAGRRRGGGMDPWVHLRRHLGGGQQSS